MAIHFSEWIRGLTTGGLTGTPRQIRWWNIAAAVVRKCEQLKKESDEQLRQRVNELRWKVQKGQRLMSLAADAFSLVREASRRHLGMTHFPQQIVGGLAVLEGCVAEMQTGEGKTLTALQPTFLHALQGKGCHVITTNDYLARRDAEFAATVFEPLGLSVGSIQNPDQLPERRAAYMADVTYATEKEICFDFLYDRLRIAALGQRKNRTTGEPPFIDWEQLSEKDPVQRGFYFALIDEADSVLIDQASTPIIIAERAEPKPHEVALYEWSRDIANDLLLHKDYEFISQRRSAVLTDKGCKRLTLERKPYDIGPVAWVDLFKQVENALTASIAFDKDKDYVVIDGVVEIVDGSTGRILKGRKWQNGLHQAVEAKERIVSDTKTVTTAQVTLQSFFQKYEHLGGMTGTACTVRQELKRVYKMPTARIATHRPCIRKGLPTKIFRRMDEKVAAIAKEVALLQATGRAILVGTPSIEASLRIAAAFEQQNIEFQLLHARVHDQEAAIVAEAGRSGRVTIATNMAGRGTDIKIDDAVREQGGLHVIATEMHESARIDRQLIGRTARQGDPGSYQFFLSLDDEVFDNMPASFKRKLERRQKTARRELLPGRTLRWFQLAQLVNEKIFAEGRTKLFKKEKQMAETLQELDLDAHMTVVEQL